MEQNYRLKCRNDKCGYDTLKRWRVEEFDQLAYGGDRPGIDCFQCGYPKMKVEKSHRRINDGFKPGFQRNIMKHCETYAEYKAHLKAMGLIELGYEDIPEGEETERSYWNDKTLKKAHDRGFRVSGREAEALKKNKL